MVPSGVVHGALGGWGLEHRIKVWPGNKVLILYHILTHQTEAHTNTETHKNTHRDTQKYTRRHHNF